MADLVLAIIALEFAALVMWRRRSGRGPRVPAILFALLPGVALVLALRAALVGAPWSSVACWLALAGVAHIADLRARLFATSEPRQK